MSIERKKKICKCGCGEGGYIYARGMLLDCDRRENPHKHGFTMSSSVDAKPVRKKTAHKIVKNATLKRTKRDSAFKQRDGWRPAKQKR